MSLHDARPLFEERLDPLVDWCCRREVNPNTLSVLGLVLSFAAAAVFYASTPERGWTLIVGSALLTVGATLDSLDGLVARATGQASPLGDYLDHAFDRFADVALLLGFTFSPWVPLEVGLFAIVGTLLTSYMGTQAQAVGVGRDYGGLVGRADRILILAWAPLLELVRLWLPAVGLELAMPWGLNLIYLGLAWIAVAGTITALQRFWVAYGVLSGDD